MSNVNEIVTPVGYLAFNKFLGEKDPNKDAFKAAILFDKDAKLDKLKKFLDEAATNAGLDPSKKSTKMPLKEYEGDAEYAQGKYVLNFSTKFPIAFVNTKGNEVTANSFKAGDKIKVALTAYNWTFEGKKGVSCNINGMLLVESCADEEKFYQSRSGASIFGIKADEDEDEEDF